MDETPHVPQVLHAPRLFVREGVTYRGEREAQLLHLGMLKDRGDYVRWKASQTNPEGAKVPPLASDELACMVQRVRRPAAELRRTEFVQGGDFDKVYASSYLVVGAGASRVTIHPKPPDVSTGYIFHCGRHACSLPR